MSFDSFNILGVLKKTLTENQITKPTEIQTKVIPTFLEKKDLIACSSTGSGKTLAFLLPLINLLYRERYRSKPKHTRALILVPTTELAKQIEKQIKIYSAKTKLRYTLITTGRDIGVQKHETSRGLDIIVATPGRLLTLFAKSHIKLNDLEYLILDEADLMLDMGFIKDIQELLFPVPEGCVKTLFSATFNRKTAALTKEILNDPAVFGVTINKNIADGIEQIVAKVQSRYKPSFLYKIIMKYNIRRGMVFAKTKKSVKRIAEFLLENGVNAAQIHGDLSRREREETLQDFSDGKIEILVATDVAARGIHVDRISHIINYTLPRDPETYIHRLGRTGRGKANGFAASLYDEKERNELKAIEKLLGFKIKKIKISDEDASFQASKNYSGSRKPKRK